MPLQQLSCFYGSVLLLGQPRGRSLRVLLLVNLSFMPLDLHLQMKFHTWQICYSRNYIVGSNLWLDWKVITSRYTETYDEQWQWTYSSSPAPYRRMWTNWSMVSCRKRQRGVWGDIFVVKYAYTRTRMHISYTQRCCHAHVTQARVNIESHSAMVDLRFQHLCMCVVIGGGEQLVVMSTYNI